MFRNIAKYLLLNDFEALLFSKCVRQVSRHGSKAYDCIKPHIPEISPLVQQTLRLSTAEDNNVFLYFLLVAYCVKELTSKDELMPVFLEQIERQLVYNFKAVSQHLLPQLRETLDLHLEGNNLRRLQRCFRE